MKRLFLAISLIGMMGFLFTTFEAYTKTQVQRIAKNLSSSYWDEEIPLYALLRCNLFVHMFETDSLILELSQSDREASAIPFYHSANKLYESYQLNWLTIIAKNPTLIQIAAERYGDVFIKEFIKSSMERSSIENLNRRLKVYNESIMYYEHIVKILLETDESKLNRYIQSFEHEPYKKQLTQLLLRAGYPRQEKYLDTLFDLKHSEELLELFHLVRRISSAYYVPPRKFMEEFYLFLKIVKEKLPFEVKIIESTGNQLIFEY